MLSPERSESNGIISRPPPVVMPHVLAEVGAYSFSQVVIEQRDRLKVTFSDSQIDDLEFEFKAFLNRYEMDGAFNTLVNKHGECNEFSEAWGWLFKDYPMLVTFIGGLATTFPGTSTVEADFSAIGYEKDANRWSLSDLSLEGILHAKQQNTIMRMEHSLRALK
jgi:hypothetical protein